MVIPIGMPYANQELIFIDKDYESKIRERKLLDVSFVPLKNGT